MASFDSVLFVLRPFSLPWNAVRFQFQLRHGCMCRARVIKRLDALHSLIKIRQIATNSSGERFLGFSKALSFFFLYPSHLHRYWQKPVKHGQITFLHFHCPPCNFCREHARQYQGPLPKFGGLLSFASPAYRLLYPLLGNQKAKQYRGG